MHKGNILCIDDDAAIRMVLEDYLEDDGYKVVTASNGNEAVQKINEGDFDVVLLDLVLPDTEGLSLISKINQKTYPPAIIVVSGKSDTTEKIVTLEMGADDYVTKPFDMRELSARIKAVSRRAQQEDRKAHNPSETTGRIKFGRWILDRAQYQVFDDQGHSAGLTTGEFQLLEALVLSANVTLSREKLFELTRDEDFDVYDRAVDIQIARVRKKLGDNSKDPQMIKTVRGIGYIFSAETQML